MWSNISKREIIYHGNGMKKNAFLLIQALLAQTPLSTFAQAEASLGARYEVEPSLSGDHLVGIFQDQRYWITNYRDEYSEFSIQNMVNISIEWEGDFDADGFNDVLIKASDGGTASPPQYFIASHLGGNFFSLTSSERLFTYGDYELLHQESGETFLKVYHKIDGPGNHNQMDSFGIYRLLYGKVEMISEAVNHAQIQTLLDITSEEISKLGRARYQIDLDGDGISDNIDCHYWDHWGDVVCSFQLSKHGNVESSVGVDHLGISVSVTNGVNDLVYNWNSLLKYENNIGWR